MFDQLFMYAMWALILWALIWGQHMKPPPKPPVAAPSSPREPSLPEAVLIGAGGLIAGLLSLWAAVVAFCAFVLVALFPIGLIVYLFLK